MNYVPDHRARALRLARSGALALVMPDVNNSVFAELVAGVQQVAAPAGVAVLLGQVSTPATGPATLTRLVGQGRVGRGDLAAREDFDDAMLAATIDLSIPVVLFNSCLARRPGSVTLDDREAPRVAVQHLVELGHRRIAFLGGTPLHDAAKRRLSGYRAAMNEAKLSVEGDWVVHAGWKADSEEQGLLAVLRSRRPPTAVVAASVNAALGAASVAAHQGIRIPEQLSVVAVQDSWVARVVTHALTVVRMPLRRAGAAAPQMIIDHLAGVALQDVVITDPAPELVVRASTAPPAD